MKKLYIQNESPVREERVSLSDKSSSIVVAFVLPRQSELEALQKTFMGVLGKDAKDENIKDFLRTQVKYFKEVALNVYGEGDQDCILEETIAIPDSRTPPEAPDYWTDRASCLEILFNTFFESTTWRTKIFVAYTDYITKLISGTLDQSEEEVKN